MVNVRQNKLTIGRIIFLCFSIAIYSLSGFFTKLAAGYAFISMPYLLCLIAVFGVLGIYAVLWQMILKRVPLSMAYPFRSLGVVYGLAIAGFAFHELITWQNILGGAIVMFGLFIMATDK